MSTRKGGAPPRWVQPISHSVDAPSHPRPQIPVSQSSGQAGGLTWLHRCVRRQVRRHQVANPQLGSSQQSSLHPSSNEWPLRVLKAGPTTESPSSAQEPQDDLSASSTHTEITSFTQVSLGLPDTTSHRATRGRCPRLPSR